MSKVSLFVVMAVAAVADGLVTDRFKCALTDSAGAAQSVDIPVSSFQLADPAGPNAGKMVATVDFINDVPVGSFGGSVQAVQTDGSNVGSPVSFSGSVSAPQNMQPVPVSVTVNVG